MPLGKFVIPNPLGPFEEPRFCAYLIRQWQAGEAAEVRTPAYVRDNIHVDLLAAAYAAFAKRRGRRRLYARQPERLCRDPGRFRRALRA